MNLKALAAKFDNAYWPKVMFGQDIQLTHQEIAAARDALLRVEHLERNGVAGEKT